MLIQHLYSVEKTNILYHKVLANRVQDGRLKRLFVEHLLPAIERKKQSLHLIIRLMDLHPHDRSTAGINGIMDECFQEIEDMENEELVDDIILHTLVVLLHYELGNYRMLLSYLQNVDLDFQITVIEDILVREEHILDLLMDTLKIEE
jgi:ferritin-like metal-binding protein YciE